MASEGAAAAAEAHGHVPTHGGPGTGFEEHAHHFTSASHERRAAQMGMWLFLVNEVLLFAGLFCAFAVYRYLYHDTFTHLAYNALDWKLGTVNTVVLLFSSFTVVLAVQAGRNRNSKMVGVWYVASIALAGVFLVVKYFEYTHKFHEGMLPGRFYSWKEYDQPGAPMFFVLYFFITGLHGLHVVIGMGILGWVAVRGFKGEFAHKTDTSVELSGMYWHLVDLIWIFVYPMIYLL